MATRFLDDAARAALVGAVREIESVSAAEVVVAIRARARRWLHVPFVVGIVTAWAGLAFMLYADHPFALASFLVNPAVLGALLGVAAAYHPPLSRWLTPGRTRRRAVIQAARATFYERGVHHTAGRTGILVYVALEERMAELVADDAVVRTYDPAEWQARAALIDGALARGGAALAAAVAGLAPRLAAVLPRADDDVNELPDAIDDGDEDPA